MTEVMKQKNYPAGMNMLEDEAITIYTLSVVVPSLVGGKRTTKSDIAYLPTYGKWRNKSLQKGLGYDLEKMLDPIHGYIKLIITDQYKSHPNLKEMDTEMSLRSVEFLSSLLDGGNTK